MNMNYNRLVTNMNKYIVCAYLYLILYITILQWVKFKLPSE